MSEQHTETTETEIKQTQTKEPYPQHESGTQDDGRKVAPDTKPVVQGDFDNEVGTDSATDVET